MIELTLETLAYGGDAVGRDLGKVVFVPLGAPGDEVQIEIVEEHASYARGEILRIIQPGPPRRQPRCQLFGRCGNCQWQHVSYETQAAAKNAIFISALRGLQGDASVFLEAPSEFGYRQRTRMHFSVSCRGQVHLGYFKRGTRTIVDVASCPLLPPYLEEGLDLCRSALSTAPGSQGTLVAVGGYQGEIHVSLHIQGGLEVARLGEALNRGPICGGKIQLGRQRHDYGSSAVEGRAGIHQSATAFCQANPAQDQRLREIVRGWATGGRVLELYAGNGNLTLDLTDGATSLCAVESSPDAVALMRRNVSKKVEVVPMRAEQAITKMARRKEHFDVVVLDPPREGCLFVARNLEKLGASKVVYVSCNPMTLARDLKLLCRSGYRIQRAQALDMMPQTSQLEAVVLLAR